MDIWTWENSEELYVQNERNGRAWLPWKPEKTIPVWSWKEKRKVHDNIWMAAVGRDQRKCTETNLKWNKKRQKKISLKLPNNANGKWLSWVEKNDKSITALLEKYNYSTVFLEKKDFNKSQLIHSNFT